MVRYIHGSADSTDLDMVYVFETMPSFEKCQIFCRSDPKESRNIVVVKDGIVAHCFKGNEDEVNNALMATYTLHEQAYPLIIARPVPRDVFLKDITITRKVISPLTETQTLPDNCIRLLSGAMYDIRKEKRIVCDFSGAQSNGQLD